MHSQETKGTFEAVAITGLSLRLPGATTKEAYWENLMAKKSAIQPVSDLRKKLAKSPEWTTQFGELDNIHLFDYPFFDMTHDQVRFMDPQQRLSLEVAYEVLEDAGMVTDCRDEQSVGVYMSNCVNSYNQLVIDYLEAHRAAGGDKGALGSGLLMGCIDSAVSSQITHIFNLVGPAFHLNSACSSFAVQLDVALKDIARGHIKGALIIAANILATDFVTDMTVSAGIISKGDLCRVFDQRADGTLVGEGLVGIYIEPQEVAIENNKHIYGLIRGIAVNNDGFALSLTSPNPKRQYEAMALAYERAKVDPSTVTYVEAHGTGTVIGDPIECNALLKLFKSDHQERKVYLGAAKTNVGHLLGAAGGVGLAKVLLSMAHETLAPTINLETLNPALELHKTPFEIVTETMPWVSQGPRTAGINCFGIGGTNTHLIVQEFKDGSDGKAQRHLTREENPACQFFAFSAKSESALENHIKGVTHYCKNHGDRLPDVRGTLNRYRRHYPYRAFGLMDEGGQMQVLGRGYVTATVGKRLHVHLKTQEPMEDFGPIMGPLALLHKAVGKKVFFSAEPQVQEALGSLEIKWTEGDDLPQCPIKIDLEDQGYKLWISGGLVAQFTHENWDFQRLLGMLYIHGVQYIWEHLHQDRTFVVQSLPHYPFEGRPVWIESMEESMEESSEAYETERELAN